MQPPPPAEPNRQRPFLSRAAQALAAAANFSDALAHTIGAALPELGDFGYFDVVDGQRLLRSARAHDDEALQALLQQTEWVPQPPGEPAGAQPVPACPFEYNSMITAPMRYRGELIGALTLFMGRSGRAHSAEQIELAQELATLAAPIVANGRLIEQHTQAREALAKSEEFLRTATEAGGLGLWEWDVPNDRIICSDRLFELHGLPPGSPGERSADFIALVHPDDLPAVIARRDAALAGTSRYLVEFRPLRPDGRACWLSASAQVVRDGAGRPLRMLGATMDVTHRVELLAAERRARAEAESARQRLELLAAEAEEARRQAEQARRDAEDASRAKDEFLAMLGHELRNPLAPIVTMLKVMELNDEHAFSNERRVIERQVANLSRLVDDLLDVARITRGEVRLKRERVRLLDVVNKAVEIATPLLESRRHRLEIDLPEAAGVVVEIAFDADEGRLAQVFANLLTNAARYTPEGGRIRLQAEVDDAVCRIGVHDDGLGIAPDVLPRIFDLFFQAAQGPDRAAGGLGIGLALVKNLVGLHGGRVTAHSEGPGRGSSFVVELPLAGPQSATAEPASAAETAAAPPQRKRVLLVDDNRDALESLAMMLELHGHEVRSASDPTDGLALAAGFDPEVAILDIGLPGMDGYELASRLRASGTMCRLIALTGYGLVDDVARSRAAGFDQHLVKPIDPALLIQALG